MDTRTTSADFYPGGKTPVTAGGGITSGEGEAYNGEQRVPITSIEGLPERFTEGDMKSKIDDICKVLRTGGLALAAILSFPAWGGITVHGTRKDRIYNDGFVVTNVTADLKVLTTNDVCNIVTNEVVKDEWELVGTINTDQIETDGDISWEVSFFDERWWVYINWIENGINTGTTLWVNETEEDATILTLEHNRYVDGFFRRKNAGVNALGLARMKDLEKLPNHETVTNVARSVVNSVWDASLGVAWEARMHNGHLYYIAVTNQPTGGK